MNWRHPLLWRLVPFAILSFGLLGNWLEVDRYPALRDAGHYYPSLLQTVSASWREGWPLWNPLEERGRPLLADPTAGVFYPIHALCFQCLPFPTSYKLDLFVHLAIAGWGMWRLARRLDLNEEASALASLSYWSGGFLLFQVHNVPYLIGGAWLPWIVEAIVDYWTTGKPRSLSQLIVTLALVIFGGDLQTAHGVFVAVAILVGGSILQYLWLRHTKLSGAAAFRRGFQLSLATSLVLLLTAIQWLPTWSWAGESSRVLADRTAPSQFDSRWHGSRLDFSVGPWRWVELAWPRFSGSLGGQNTRWMPAFGAEERAWVPSLYAGLLTAGFAASAVTLRLPQRRKGLLVGGFVFGIWASLGRYDPLALMTGGEGGLFSWLSFVLPGFSVFRYPAKMWLLSTLSLSLLAGHGLNDSSFLPRLRCVLQEKWGRRVSAIGLALLALAISPWGLGAFEIPASDPVWGPIDYANVRRGQILGLVQLSVVGCVAWTIGTYVASENARRVRQLLVLLTVVDLIFAHRDACPLVRYSTTHTPRSLAAEQVVPDRELVPPLVWRYPGPSGWYPADWATNSSPTRLHDCVVWDRRTCRAKYPLDDGHGFLRGATSFSAAAQLGCLEWIDQLAMTDPARAVEALRFLGVRFIVAPTTLHWPGASRRESVGPFHDEAACWIIDNPLPFAWLVHATESSPAPQPQRRLSVGHWMQQMRQIMAQLGSADRSRSVAILSTPTSNSAGPSPSATPPTSRYDRCTLTTWTATEQKFDTELASAGWLVINHRYAPGWQAKVVTGAQRQSASVIPANGIMMAVALPAGSHQVTLTYSPREFTWGAGLSGLGVFLAICWGGRRILPRRFDVRTE